MKAYLLDVNVLVALLWPAHQAHAAAQRWFGRKSRLGWATCPFTEADFVRIVSNPAFSRDAVGPEDAIRILNANLEHRYHHFWKDSISFARAAASFRGRLAGHRQVTDAYLLGLAIENDGKLATMDAAILALLPERHPERSRVELLTRTNGDSQ